MRFAMINGSPKMKNSATEIILNMIKDGMQGMDLCVPVDVYWDTKGVKEESLEEVASCDTLVLAFPLYVDCIPSHVVRWMKAFEQYVKENKTEKKYRVFAVVNCGFYEAKHNLQAIEVVRNWSQHLDAVFCSGLAIGAGGMIVGVYEKFKCNGPLKPINEKARELTAKIIYEPYQNGDVVMVQPAFPSPLYLAASHGMWKSEAKKNGLTVQDLSMKTWDRG